MNSFGEVALIRMGMKEWFVPQISEHCPENRPSRLDEMKVWLRRPGRASTFTPIEGTAHEWITSIDDTKTRIEERTGILRWSLVFNSRFILEFSMNLSTSVLFREVYS